MLNILQFNHRDNAVNIYACLGKQERKEIEKMNNYSRPNDHIVSIRLLPEEAEILKAKAEEAHMSKARFLKNVLLYGGAYERTNFTKSDTDKLLYEIDRIANNLNQILVHVYGDEKIHKTEVVKLRDNYYGLLSAFYDFVHGKEK